MVVHWTHSLHDDDVGALKMWKEIAGAAGKEQEHVIPWLDLLALGRVVLGPLLFRVG